MKSNWQTYVSKYFRLQKLADGIYAAVNILGNAGIVDLGDRTLVYDSLFMPQAGEDLRNAAESLIGRPIASVINSHWHYGHIWGNQVFSAFTNIISTVETRRMIIATRGVSNYDSAKVNAEKNLESLQAKYQATENMAERRQLAPFIDDYQSIVEAMPILQVRAPNLTFDQYLTFYGTDRSAELIPFIGGHTESDAVLFLPQEGIVFMSDLLFVDTHPYLGDGDPYNLRQILEVVSELRPKILVPGHGPVGGPESLQLMKQYIDTLDGLARSMVEDNEAEEMIDDLAIPAPFDDWLLAALFPENIRVLYQRLLTK
jgi:glyoxylase-like metal-dependent hydrolase (beta-lactamase superfamily II)